MIHGFVVMYESQNRSAVVTVQWHPLLSPAMLAFMVSLRWLHSDVLQHLCNQSLLGCTALQIHTAATVHSVAITRAFDFATQPPIYLATCEHAHSML